MTELQGNSNENSTVKNYPAPHFIYGTAWKEEKTADLTFQALEAGFTAIDTANQRKHYFEEAVGLGIQKFLESRTPEKIKINPQINILSRNDLFLQTKFTYSRGQDHRKPYNENDSFTQQVVDSFASSLKHLKTNYIDSYILHGPYNHMGIGKEDLETWIAMENLIDTKQVRFIGISNVSAKQLIELCNHTRILPTFVQNRCYANMGWDKEVREICKSKGIAYQGFSLLTANRAEMALPNLTSIAQKYKKTASQIIFRFSQQVGMICLTGSSSREHLNQDLDISKFELTDAELKMIENISRSTI